MNGVGLHGAVGLALGHRPIFGVEPPLVFTTFRPKIPRTHLLVIALAPLIILDAAFVVFYTLGVWRLFMNLCFAVKTIGAVGDVWIALNLVRHGPHTLIQDTKTGVKVWEDRAPRTG